MKFVKLAFISSDPVAGLTTVTGGGLASGSALFSVNEVSLRRARLVLGWVTSAGG